MVDLFDAEGAMPRTIVDVEARRKDIVYASRSNRSIGAHRLSHNLRRAIMALWEALPPEKKADRHLSELADLGCTTTMHIVRLVCRTDPYDLPSKDYEFSRQSLSEHMAAGYRDARSMLERRPWLRYVQALLGLWVMASAALLEAAPNMISSMVSGHVVLFSAAASKDMFIEEDTEDEEL